MFVGCCGLCVCVVCCCVSLFPFVAGPVCDVLFRFVFCVVMMLFVYVVLMSCVVFDCCLFSVFGVLNCVLLLFLGGVFGVCLCCFVRGVCVFYGGLCSCCVFCLLCVVVCIALVVVLFVCCC